MALMGTGAANAAIAAVLVPGTTYYLSVGTASPGTTGANEMAGVTRQAVVMTSASGGAESNTAAIAIPTPGTQAATHALWFSAATAGNYLIGAQLASPVTATSITFAAGAATATAS
jgi:hypothetical protein